MSKSNNAARKILVEAFVGRAHKKMVDLGMASREERQGYHDASHPRDVYVGAKRAAQCLVGNDGFQAVEDLIWMACSAHDVIQEADFEVRDGFRFRVRRRGPNEQKTADWAAENLRQLREQLGGDTITDEEIQRVHQAIMWTTPAWNQDMGTVIQPLFHAALDADGPLDTVAVAVAMGDLLPPGHHPEAFLRASDPLFVEEWVGIEEMFRTAKKQSDIPREQRLAALELMRKHDAGQITFALGRRKAFEKEISYFSPSVQSEFRNRVNKFEISAKRAAERASHRLSLDPMGYANAMGFKDLPME